MTVRNALRRALMYGLAMLAPVAPVHAQQRVAASLTDPNDPTFITEQTRKQGGPMPAELQAFMAETAAPGEYGAPAADAPRASARAPRSRFSIDAEAEEAELLADAAAEAEQAAKQARR